MINSINRGIDVLKSLSNGTERITDLCDELQLSKGTVYRLLKSLEASEMVKQDPITRRYYLGPLIFELSSKPFVAHQNLIVSAFTEMQYLRGISRETVVLHIRTGLERVCLEELQSPENIKYSAGKGAYAPIYVGSAGKILLAELKDVELQLIMENISLSPVTENTITDKKVLLKELEKVRKQSYATSVGERVMGAASISIPIRNYVCPVALSILGPENRFGAKMLDFLKQMQRSGSRISKKLLKST